MIEYKFGRRMSILFVGSNPHPGSYRRGVPFSNNKTFWYLLNRAGLLHENESDLRNDSRLKEVYDRRFLSHYGLGFINLVDRPTVQVAELKKREERPGVERVLKTIQTYKPQVVCFIGKITYVMFRSSRECDFGWQEDIGDSRIYVMHFPIRGPAAIRITELQEMKEASRSR